MSDAKTETPKFKLTLRDFSAFYAEWRKRNVSFKNEAKRLALYIFLLGAVFLWNSRANFTLSGLSTDKLALTGILLVVGIGVAALLVAAFLVFILSPALIYAWQAVRFLTGPVGKYCKQPLRALSKR